MQKLKRWYIGAVLVLILGMGIWQGIPYISTHFASANNHAKGAATTPFTHVVIVMMENHSFDNMFGLYPGANGIKETPASNPLPSDLDHGAPNLAAAMDGGKMDEFPSRGQVQYSQSDIPLYWKYAQNYGLGDNFFTSIASSSAPNHLAMFAAQNHGLFESTAQFGCNSLQNNLIQSKDATTGNEYWSYPCYNIKSLPTLLDGAGLSWRYYSSTPIWDAPLMTQSYYNSPNNIVNPNQFFTDVSSGNLANVSWLIPPGAGKTDHPPNMWEGGQNFVNSVVNTIAQSQQNYWNNTAIFVTWDDWGGFYDHVVPPVVDNVGLGPRTPLLSISAYNKPGYISHVQGEFSSFDKFIEEDFNLGNLGQRDSLTQTGDLMDYFDFSKGPQPPLILSPLNFQKTLVVPDRTPNPAVKGGTITGALNHFIGGTNTTYTYSIVYTQKGLPTTYNVNIDGVAHAMTELGPISGGKVYQYSTSLGTGIHNFSFTFSGGSGNVTIPDNGVLMSGPEVHSFNVQHVSISPSVALPGQPVTYSVSYSTTTGKAATRSELDIDGIAHTMTTKGGDYTKGVTYTYTTSSLSIGVHYYRFVFNDGNGTGAGYFEGSDAPSITPVVLSQSSVSPASGPSSTVFTFQTTYTETSGSAPKSANVYIDGAVHAMACNSSCTYSTGAVFQYSTTLSSGNHSFYFVFSDTSTSWPDPFAPSVYAGPTVGAANAQTVPTGTIISPSHDDDPDIPMSDPNGDNSNG